MPNKTNATAKSGRYSFAASANFLLRISPVGGFLLSLSLPLRSSASSLPSCGGGDGKRKEDVGTVVGVSAVGACVGDIVVGAVVGRNDGGSDGAIDGVREGALLWVGTVLAKNEGAWEGATLALGDVLGTVEGANDAVGEGVGRDRGSRQKRSPPSSLS